MRNLADTPVLVVDCQSTGATPAHGRVIELAWCAVTLGDPVREADVRGRLLALPADERVPMMVTRLTGIHTRDLEEGHPPATAWRELCHDAERIARASDNHSAPTVIHFARFEEAFLVDLDTESGDPFPLDIVCSHEIARRLLPALPRRGLRALAGYFGFTSPQLRRSPEHVAATAFVWSHLVRELDDLGVNTWAELHAWLQEKPGPRPSRHEYPMDRDKRLGLPNAPGVYRMLRNNGDVLYVGKATSLKTRVNSYFGKQRRVSERHLEMLTQARDLDVTVTATPLEAALLETDEIKRLTPPYNRVLLAERQLYVDSLPGEAEVLGPFPYRNSLAPLIELGRIWLQPVGSELPERSVSRLLGVSPQWAPDPEVYWAGVEMFRRSYSIEPNRRRERGVLRLGTPLWSARQVEEQEEDEERVERWNAERVFEKLEEVVRRVGHLARRARWMCRVAESTVAWREPRHDRWRALVFAGGQIIARLTDVDPGAIPFPPDHRRSFAERQAALDIAMYDRLRTLTTELRRVIADRGDAMVRFGPRAITGREGLRRLMRMV